MRIGTCKLCKREHQELQDSHLMPQGLYKRIRSEQENSPHPILIDKSGSRPISDQISDYVFCNRTAAATFSPEDAPTRLRRQYPLVG
jgi:hypothetical protein